MEGAIRARAVGGTSNRSRSSGSQARVASAQRSVREAFVGSVTWAPPRGPPVRFQITQESIVPIRRRPEATRGFASGTLARSQWIFVAEKYVRMGSPVRERTSGSKPPAMSARHFVSVRVSCQTIAGAIGIPESASQRTTVSRWFVTPSASTGSRGPAATVSATTRSTLSRISRASCSTQPGWAKVCACSRYAEATTRPARSNRKQRVPVVPWSIAARRDIGQKLSALAPRLAGSRVSGWSKRVWRGSAEDDSLAVRVRAEIFNSVTHIVGSFFAAAGLVVRLAAGVRTGDPGKVGSFAVYGAALVALYLFSTLYHSLDGRPVPWSIAARRDIGQKLSALAPRLAGSRVSGWSKRVWRGSAEDDSLAVMVRAEIFNSVTHIVGSFFAAAGLVFLLAAGVRTGDPWKIGSFA